MLQGSLELEISSISHHCKAAEKGSVFVCIRGADADGHDFAEEAVRKGAVAVVCQQPMSLPDFITLVQVSDSRKALACIAQVFYGYPGRELTLIGVTGTKGKTTTAFMIQALLKQTGIKTGLVGTVQIDTGERVLESSHTTPDPLQLLKGLREMVDCGCKAAVLEVSSQALMLERTEGLFFDYGVFTNIESDHIGPREHETFEEYAYWKSRLFTRCAHAVVNGDDPNLELILKDCTCPVTTYGFGESNDLVGYGFENVRLPGKLGVEFSIKGDYNIDLVVSMAGEFSCFNAMAAVAVGRNFCRDKDTVRRTLCEICVPGRQEMFAAGSQKVIMVDYAHNGTALRKLLQAVCAYRPKKLTCIFGCGGQRDPKRRTEMGAAAAEYADFSIITSDNPRNEPPEAIIADIVSAVRQKGGSFTVISDRREAILYAVAGCIPGEIVVVAGKGHENYQITGDKKIHFDDREEVLRAIEKVNYERNYTS